VKISTNENLRRSLTNKYWRSTRKVLVKVRQPIVDMSEYVDADRLKNYTSMLLQTKVMNEHLLELWSKVGGKFAYDTEKMLKRSKSRIPEMETKDNKDQLSLWEGKMKHYAAERSLIKAKAILSTEQEAINKVIDDVIAKINEDGLGIPAGRKLMRDTLIGDDLSIIESWQAERIARTEVNGASNSGSFEAAQENKEGVKKEWLTSGLPGVRESHQKYESMGPQEMEYEYNIGLQFPGDENGDADEIINCRCTIVYDTGN
jgi:hypothetical protein